MSRQDFTGRIPARDTALSLSRSLDTQKVGRLSEYLRHCGEHVSKSKTSWIYS